MRNRARYEVANNCYARGILLTLANDLIGRGPRLQLVSNQPDLKSNLKLQQDFRRVEVEWIKWSRAINLADKLRTMKTARGQDGEAFAILITNPKLKTAVQLDLRLVEAEQVTDNGMLAGLGDRYYADGISFDEHNNPTNYRVLKEHPGEFLGTALGEADDILASDMIHWFRCDRPGQVRGVPDIMPALPLFAQLRRYTLAVLGAAETAADFAAILKTQSTAAGEADEVDQFLAIDIEQRSMVTMPHGWEMEQFKAEQPTTTYAEFKWELINEIARCLNIPFNVAALNSSKYNYASGRLDHQTYHKALVVEQDWMELEIINRIWSAWIDEAALIPGLLPGLPMSSIDVQWFWDGTEHVDPAKEAAAQEKRLANHTTTLADEYAKEGKDWEAKLRQRGREFALITELGLPISSGSNVTENDDSDRDETDEQSGDDSRETEESGAAS